MKTFLIGVGAAGNKAVVNAVELGIMDVEDTCIVNSTSKDFPKDYKGTKIILTDGDTGCGKERLLPRNIPEKLWPMVSLIFRPKLLTTQQ